LRWYAFQSLQLSISVPTIRHLQSLKDGSGEPAMLVASDSEKELNRAKRVMGMAWVNQVG